MKPTWQTEDGRVQLYRGDSLEIVAGMEPATVDALITDPPYSSGGAFRGDRVGKSTSVKYQMTGTDKEYPEFTGDSRDQRAYGHWCALWLDKCLEATKPGGVAVLFTDWRQLPTTTDALQAGGWVWRGVMPWDKTEAARPSKGRYRNQCEYMVWGSKGGMSDEGPCLPGYFRQSVIGSEKLHVAGKPVPVMEQVVAIAWRDDATVLDTFMGSASTGVAAVRAGKRFIGVEKSPEYFDIAVDRIKAELERAPLFEAGREVQAFLLD